MRIRGNNDSVLRRKKGVGVYNSKGIRIIENVIEVKPTNLKIEKQFKTTHRDNPPRYIADTQRAREILAAMDRYLEAGKVIPAEWHTELNERIAGAVRPVEAGEIDINQWRVDCGVETCDKCMFVWGTKKNSPHCGHFYNYYLGEGTLTATGDGNYLRLPRCLEAEKNGNKILKQGEEK
jgi:nitrous oxidase accessory protein NosD